MSADADLAQELAALHRKFELGDTISAWNAIARITAHNKNRNAEPYPLPAWLNEYLLRAAEKIERLSFGIRPDDDRPATVLIESGEFGYLRKVRQSDSPGGERYRDERAVHIGAALGLAGKGRNAFQRHDRIENDDSFLRIWDDPTVADDQAMRNKVRRVLALVVEKQEGVTRDALENRLSKARQRRRSRPQ